MSPRNHRAAAAAVIGLLAGGVSLSATTATASNGSRDTPVDPAPGNVGQPPGATGGGGTTPQNTTTTPTTTSTTPTTTTPTTTPTPPATGDLTSGAQCGQVIFTNTLPTVITCGPVTITFNTVTTTTTLTSVTAPITAANGPISTAVTTPAAVAPVTTRQCAPATRIKHLKTSRTKHRSALGKRKSTTLVLKPTKGSRTVKFRVIYMAHPSR
jgi:hypothetical protein